MKPIPVVIDEIDVEKGYPQLLKKGKTYTINTIRHLKSSHRIAMIIYKIAGQKRSVFFQVDALLLNLNYSLKFKATAAGESLLLTYWEKKPKKWVQLDGKEFIKPKK